MSYYEFRQKIAMCQEEIYNTRKKIQLYNDRLNELYDLQQQYVNIENNFNIYNKNRLCQAEQIKEVISTFKFSKRLSENIIDSCTGTNYFFAIKSIEYTQNKIKIEIQRTKNIIDEYNQHIFELDKKILEIEYQIMQLNLF